MALKNTLNISSLTIHAGKTPRVLIADFSTEVPSGKMIALTGLNGTGKSTLLYAIAGLADFHLGKITIRDKNMQTSSALEKSRLVSMVFTQQENIPWMDVYSFIATGRSPYTSYFGSITIEDEKIIEEVLMQTGLETFRHRFINTLSDGEKQRCLIARSLVQQTPLLILDEPTAFLDIRHKKQILELLSEIVKHNNISVLFSTHDIHLAKKYAHEIWWIDAQRVKISDPTTFSEEVFL